MHLRDAMIDVDGSIYGRGSISFPPDPAGRFVPSAAEYVRLTMLPSDAFTLTACDVYRDQRTGYLVGETSGPSVSVSGAVASIVRGSLRSGLSGTRAFSLDETGYLSAEPGGRSQGLSAWRGFARDADDAVDVGLSAALKPVSWAKYDFSAVDAWATVPGASRVHIAFTMDVVTRVVRFGGYAKSMPESPVEVGPHTMLGSVHDMRLETAPLGFNRGFCGISDDGRLFDVHETGFSEFRQLTIEGPRQPNRYACGLMTTKNSYPRITFRGIDLDLVASSMWSDRSFALRLTGGKVGSVQYTSDSADGPGDQRKLDEADLSFELTERGLEFTYAAQPDGARALSGRITLPWEVISIRSPLFVRHRASLEQGRAFP